MDERGSNNLHRKNPISRQLSLVFLLLAASVLGVLSNYLLLFYYTHLVNQLSLFLTNKPYLSLSYDERVALALNLFVFYWAPIPLFLTEGVYVWFSTIKHLPTRTRLLRAGAVICMSYASYLIAAYYVYLPLSTAKMF